MPDRSATGPVRVRPTAGERLAFVAMWAITPLLLLFLPHDPLPRGGLGDLTPGGEPASLRHPP